VDRALTEGRALVVTWVNRGTLHLVFVLNGHHGIITTNGLFRPFALVHGGAVATWALAGGRVTVRPLEDVPPEDIGQLRADAVRVTAYLGLPPPMWTVQEGAS
jgi:hypothetical protein